MGRPIALLLCLLLTAACSQARAPESAAPASAAAESATASPSPTPTAAALSVATPTPTPIPPPKWDELPVAAQDPDGLGQQLAMVDAGIRDPNVSGAQLAWLGHLQQLAYGRLQDFPDWKPAVLAALPEASRPAVTASLDAGKQLSQLKGPVPKTLPDWKIVAPRTAETLMGFYKEAEATFGVPWYYLASIHLVETRMGRIRGLSSAGAQGPMQFMPGTWAMYGKGDINDDHDSILSAARYLVAAGAPNDMQKALYAYNHSLFYVNALILYANVMKADPAAYRGYWGWQVYYPTQEGPILLPVGWSKE